MTLPSHGRDPREVLSLDANVRSLDWQVGAGVDLGRPTPYERVTVDRAVANVEAWLSLPWECSVELVGYEGIVPIPGFNTKIDTGAAVLSIPYAWWSKYGLTLIDQKKRNMIFAGHRRSAQTGYCLMRIHDSRRRRLWPTNTAYAQVPACLMPKPRRPPPRDTLLIGLGAFHGARICIHLDPQRPHAGVFRHGSQMCFERLGPRGLPGN